MNRETDFTELVSAAIEPWIVIGLMVVFIGIGLIFRGKCPKCRRYRTFRKTGATRRDRGLIFGTICYEHRCTQCGFTDWGEDSSAGGGDGGD